MIPYDKNRMRRRGENIAPQEKKNVMKSELTGK